MKKIFCLLTLLGLYFGTQAQPAFVRDSLDTYVQREIQRWDIPGAAVAIVKDGKIIACKGYGVRDTLSGAKVDAKTLFMIASNTKAFTATSLAMLQEEGRMSLDDKVCTYIPDFTLYDTCATQMVTVRDLLCHRIGMGTFEGDFLNWDSNLSRSEVIHAIHRNKPQYPFRTTWGYCNAAFVTAGEIIPVVTDTSWDDYLQYHFFDPLDMKRSSTHYADIASDNNACKPYTLWMDKLVQLDYDSLDNLGPCASVNSSAEDLAHWLIMQLNNGMYNGKEVVSPAALQETRTPNSIVDEGSSVLLPSQHFDLYGLGLELSDYEGKKIVSHTGGADGFVTSVLFVPEDSLGIIVLTNTDANYFFLACTYQILNAYFNVPYSNLSAWVYNFFEAQDAHTNADIEDMYRKAAKNPSPSLPLAMYAGTYQNPVYGVIQIKAEKGKLVMHFAHHPQLTGNMLPLGDNDFVCTYDPVSWGAKKIPFTVQNGKVISVTVSINEFIDPNPYVFTKVQ